MPKQAREKYKHETHCLSIRYYIIFKNSANALLKYRKERKKDKPSQEHCL